MAETLRRLPTGTVLLTREQMLGRLSCSDSTLRRRIDEGVLPKPVEVGGPYCLRWIESEVDEAIAAMPRAKLRPRSESKPEGAGDDAAHIHVAEADHVDPARVTDRVPRRAGPVLSESKSAP